MRSVPGERGTDWGQARFKPWAAHHTRGGHTHMTEIIGTMPLTPATTTAGLITNPLMIDGHTITDQWLAEHTITITMRARTTPEGSAHPLIIEPHAIIIDGTEAYEFE